MIKHSFVVVTYNQENLISECLDSIINGNPNYFEIIIGDDCSVDNTKNIIEEYIVKYPGKIKYYRNNKNLGIFENVNGLFDKINGDVVSFIAGDDYFKPGLINELNRIIDIYNLNPNTEDFIVVTNTFLLYPDGTERIWDNFKLQNNSMIYERIRFGLSFREVGLSVSLLRKLPPIRTNIGVAADWIWGLEQIIHSKNIYFSNKAFSVYRLGTGVTSVYNFTEFAKSKKLAISILKLEYIKYLNSKDLLYLELEEVKSDYQIRPTLLKFIALNYKILQNLGNYSKNNYIYNHYKALIPAKLFFIFKKIYYNISSKGKK